MKLSRFNIEYKVDEGLIIYNSLSSGILLLEEKDILEYNKLKENKCYSKELKKELLKGNMLVDNDINEHEYIKFISTSNRYNDRGLGLTIAPTLACNFVCHYCYEKGVEFKTMNKDTIESLVDFIDRKLVKGEYLSITWYGGEPLLAIDAIEDISSKIFENKKVDLDMYSADMVTNGYLLTEEVARKLKSLKIISLQITLDGPRKIHDSRRKLSSGAGSYDVILKNIKKCCEFLNITIRVNIDKTNQFGIEELVEDLKKEGIYDKVSVYVAKVDDFENPDNINLLNQREFSNKYNEFVEKNILHNNLEKFNPNICGAVTANAYIVDPSGDLYKCWDEIGRNEGKIGNLKEDLNFNKCFSYYNNYDPLSSKKCLECEILPICMGGCPFQKRIMGDSVCKSNKYSILKNIEIEYLKYNEIVRASTTINI
ncbi:radical SAM/SPASM domain-containing protein [Peptostreptococcus faecalis]|uniref:radical SAM/SPASM domain-containing protein n=1 Tax=Peptostreptococcus faecalis TaxID=2045015 RepID=UPI000C7BBB1F|nr:radical SAM protein [Peptostreptococcus faecalis]